MLHPLPFPALSFLSSKFLFISHLLALGCFVHLSLPAEPSRCAGKGSAPGVEVGALPGGGNVASEQLKAPFEPHKLPTKPTGLQQSSVG